MKWHEVFEMSRVQKSCPLLTMSIEMSLNILCVCVLFIQILITGVFDKPAWLCDEMLVIGQTFGPDLGFWA